jgi:hypothetical protein
MKEEEKVSSSQERRGGDSQVSFSLRKSLFENR